MCLILNHLGSHILQRTTKSIPLLTVIRLHTPSKVADFDDVTLLDKDVFWLDVSVDETLLVHIVDAGTHLDEKVEGCVLRKILLFSNKVKQITLTCILQGEVNGFLIFETCVQPANVLVI